MINLHERMLPTSAGVEPATFWSPVGRHIQLSHRGGPFFCLTWPICILCSIHSSISKKVKHIQYNLNGSNTDGSFTMDDSNSFFSPYKILPIAQVNKYLGNFFLFYHGIVYCVYLLESPHRGNSNKYTQHIIIV